MINTDEGRNYRDGWTSNGNSVPALTKRRREFEDYASAKAREIDEQRLNWRYYHIDQWTPDQIKILKKRQQPLNHVRPAPRARWTHSRHHPQAANRPEMLPQHPERRERRGSRHPSHPHHLRRQFRRRYRSGNAARTA